MAHLARLGRWMHTFPYKEPVDRVEFVAADGTREIVETFLHQPAELTYDDHGYEHLVVTEPPVYAVRFTPLVPGAYRYRAWSGGEILEEGGFRCDPSDHSGYVQLSTQHIRYFSYSDGRSFCPTGLCLAGPPRYRLPEGSEDDWATLGAAEYARWFRLLAENGGNFARIWLSHPYFEVETEVAGELDLAAFARLDAVVEHARSYGIRLKLCFEHFRTFEPGTSFSKTLHHPEDGRTPASVEEWLTEPTWRKLWLKKVRAYIARYGGDPVVAVWELWNEMDCVEASWETVLSWTKEMLEEVRRLAPRQLVTSSLGSFDAEEKIDIYQDFRLPELDIQQVHRYLDQGAPWEICREDPVSLTTDAVRRMLRVDRPTLLTETGAVNDRHTGPFRYYRMDDRGILFHDTTFPAFFVGAAGTGQIWHWDQYVDQKNLWSQYRPFAALIEGLQLDQELFQMADLSNEQAWCLVLRGRGHVLLWVRNKADSWQRVLRDGEEPPLLDDLVFDLTQVNLVEGNVELFWPWLEWGNCPNEEPLKETVLVDGWLHLPPFRYALFVRISPPAHRG